MTEFWNDADTKGDMSLVMLWAIEMRLGVSTGEENQRPGGRNGLVSCRKNKEICQVRGEALCSLRRFMRSSETEFLPEL